MATLLGKKLVILLFIHVVISYVMFRTILSLVVQPHFVLTWSDISTETSCRILDKEIRGLKLLRQLTNASKEISLTGVLSLFFCSCNLVSNLNL